MRPLDAEPQPVLGAGRGSSGSADRRRPSRRLVRRRIRSVFTSRLPKSP